MNEKNKDYMRDEAHKNEACMFILAAIELCKYRQHYETLDLEELINTDYSDIPEVTIEKLTIECMRAANFCEENIEQVCELGKHMMRERHLPLFDEIAKQ